MARATAAAPKQPGRFTQMRQVFQSTRRTDPALVWWMLGAFLLGTAFGVGVAFLLRGNIVTFVLYIVLGVLLGALLALLVLGKRAEHAAYAQIEGQPGAVGAVLRGNLRRGWRGSEVPVAVNGRTRDAVYRVVGRPGAVLIAEGPEGRVQRLVDEERRKVTRVAPNVPVAVLRVGDGDRAVRLQQINRRLARLKPVLTRAEVMAVSNRLDSLAGGVPVPKGIDPNRVRSVRR